MTRRAALALLATALGVMAGACSDHSTEATPTLSRQGCDVKPGGPSGPVSDPNGPYYHQVVAARTTDGITLTATKQVLDHASVPDGVRRSDGTILTYYVNGAQGYVWVARLEGDSAEALGPITLDGASTPAGVVDPDATLLPGGRIRLAYLSNFGQPSGGVVRAICLAESDDGVSFTVIGRALSLGQDELVTDPSATPLADGSWLMAVSLGQQTIMTRSADGLAFTRYDTLRFGGVPEVTALPDGRVRLYVCAQGIVSYLSPDGGQTWQREATVVARGTGGKRIICDPSLVRGADLFLYKTAN